ncbi:MAG: hypothetical protein IJS14_14405 [Lentisphaeria bacterium]|nr:hypothetical protein [Lentisphaeria bacterium]
MFALISRHSFTAAAAAFLLLFAADSFAQIELVPVSKSQTQKEKKDTPTIINADAMDIDMANDKITLLGNVDVQDPEMNIKCRKMVIYLRKSEKNSGSTGDTVRDDQSGKEVSQIDCYGDVVITRIMPVSADGIRENQRAMAGKAVYQVKEETITLTEDPVLIQNANRLYGERIIMHTKTERVLVFKGIAKTKGKLADQKNK